MANSSSVNTAQAIKLCELCEEGRIKWRCIDCGKCICENCKTAHTKVPVTAKHQIVTITTPLKNMPRKIIMDNIPCKDHATRITCVFCQTCDRLVCQDCVSTSHSRHKFLPLETSVDKKLDQLRDFHGQIFDNLKYCKSKNFEIQNIKSKYQDIFEESIEKIQQKEKELKDAIGNYSKQLQGKLEIERSKAVAAVSKVEKHIDQVRKGLEIQKKGIKNALKSTQGSVIFKTKSSIQTLDITLDSLPKELESFLPRPEQETQIHGLFGSLQKVKVLIKEHMDFLKTCTITTGMQGIDNLLAQTETSAWIGSNQNEGIQKIDMAGDNIITPLSVPCTIIDMDLTADNDILYTDFRFSDVILLSQSGKTRPFLSVAPLRPKGIHVTRDNKVLIGTRELCVDRFKVTKESHRAVMVFDINGTRLHSFQFDKNRKKLFTIPLRITTNVNQDILFIDRTSVLTGRVVCLDKDGNLKFVYEGQYPKIKVTKEFDPRDLAATSLGHIIVCDHSSHALHVLTGRGELLFCKIIKDLGMVYPVSIDIDKKGQLWVGCGTGSKETCAKIHRVKLVW